MRRQLRWIVVTTALVTTCVVCAPAMAIDTYLFDVIKKPAYAQALTSLLDHAGKLPSWTREVLKRKGSYTGGSATPAVISGITYEMFTVCTMEYSCTDTNLAVMFAPNGTQAWGVLVQEGAMSYLGAPSDAQLQAMRGALEAHDAKWGDRRGSNATKP
ncbi:Ivy family c-type lysozyme inhibitor [Bradyrhizobium sp. UFLA05-109]